MIPAENASVPVTQRNWFKFGLYGGIAAVVITIILYVIDSALLFNQAAGYIGVVIMLALGIWAAVAEKQRLGGYIAYANAMATSMGAFITGLLISAVFNLLLFFLIDPKLLEQGKNIGMAKMDEMLDKGKISQEAYDMGLEQMEKMGSNGFLFQIIIGTIFLAIIGLIIFLISSAIIRKEGPAAPHTP